MKGLVKRLLKAFEDFPIIDEDPSDLFRESMEALAEVPTVDEINIIIEWYNAHETAPGDSPFRHDAVYNKLVNLKKRLEAEAPMETVLEIGKVH